MATPKSPKGSSEAVNSEQLEALEGQSQAQHQPGGFSTGELEERAAQAEDRAAEIERENADLKATLLALNSRMAALERAKREDRKATLDEDDDFLPGETPKFDEGEPHGTVLGDTQVAYVQNGYQFGRDRKYLGREQHRGVPRAFNPRLVGFVKPRPGAAAFDPFDGIRDKSW